MDEVYERMEVAEVYERMEVDEVYVRMEVAEVYERMEVVKQEWLFNEVFGHQIYLSLYIRLNVSILLFK